MAEDGGEGMMTQEEFRQAIYQERQRQFEHGYDTAHDIEHGVDNLLLWAQEYARRGETVSCAALIEAARELMTE